MLILPFKPLLLGRVWVIRSVESGGPSLFEPSLKIEGNTGHTNALALPPQFDWPQRLWFSKGPALCFRGRDGGSGNHSLPDRMTPALVTALPPGRIGHAPARGLARRPKPATESLIIPRTLRCDTYNRIHMLRQSFFAKSKQICRGGGDIHLVTANSRCQVLSYPARRFRS